MGLRDKFILFTEATRNAEGLLRNKGPDNKDVVNAFDYSNKLKREILDYIEVLEAEKADDAIIQRMKNKLD